MQVTFDTNTLDRVARLERFPKDPRQPDYIKVRDALRSKTLMGFFCETLVIIEGIQRKNRVATLGSTEIRTQILPETMTAEGIVATPNNMRAEQQRPPLHMEVLARVQAALALGMRALGAPRIGQTSIADPQGTIYVEEPDEDALSNRIDRFHDAGQIIESRGVGVAQIQTLASTVAKRDDVQEIWFNSLLRAKNVHEINAVARACAEWADDDSIAAHIANQNDIFCTEDMGKSAGAPSILNATNRAWLETTYGVRFVALSELAAMV
jgi:hypothetical protein